ncbi:MAG: TlpA family protein disulfide reductase [Salinibacter sp.]
MVAPLLAGSQPSQRFSFGFPVFVISLVLLGSACQRSHPSVHSYLEGRVVVDSSVTTSTNYSDFRVLVVDANGRSLDTLGHARTDTSGHFRMHVRAPERGIYPLSIWGREGRERLVSTEYVVAQGDSATLQVDLPLNGKPFIGPKSPENLALLGYENTMAMHRRMLTRRLQGDAYQPNALAQDIRLTSSTLWSLRDQFPGTYAAQFAAVQSLALLEGWNDSLVVARARRIAPSSARFVDAVRIARRAEARRHGQGAALALVDSFQARTSRPRRLAAVKAVRVQAFLDSMQWQAAFSAAQRLKSEHSGTRWANWADRIRYVANHLMPSMKAPPLTVRTLRGDTLSLNDFRGRPVVLEYYRPGSDLYNLQRPLRNALYRATRPDSVAFVSISTEPDSLVNGAYLQNQNLPGHKVIAPRERTDSLLTRYHVVHTPTWYLIDSNGRLVDHYRALELPALRRHLTALLRDTASVSLPLAP